MAVAYDPVNAELYVSDFGSPNGTNNISVVDTALNRVVATIEVPYGVGPLAVSAGGYVYFGASWSTVYRISPYTNTVASAIQLGAGCPGGCGPQPIAYDGQNGDIYIVDISSDNVSVVHNTSLVASVPVGLYPNGGAYDPHDGDIYVENEGGSMTVINGSTNLVVGTIPLPDPGPGVVYDPSNGDIYVCQNTKDTGNVVTVINTTAGQTIDTIPVGAACHSETFDPGNGFLYVPDTTFAPPHVNGYAMYQSNVTVIDTRSNSVVSLLPVQKGPYGITYDPGNERVYVADAFTNNLSVLPMIYNLTFQPGSWLPSGTTWTLTLGNLTLWSNSSNVRFAEPNGTYSYTLHVIGYPLLNTTGLVSVNGSAVSITLAQPGSATYPVTFSEVGLQRGTPWTVTLAGLSQGTATGRIAFTEPNGTYAYLTTAGAGYRLLNSSPSSPITVNGEGVNVTSDFVAVYPATFTELGLSSGTEWYVNISSDSSIGSETNSITLAESNGTYAFAVWTGANYTATPSNGALLVRGAAEAVSITFVSTYGVTFVRPSGTSTGASWTVYLNMTSGVGHSSAVKTTAAATLTFLAPNGTYSYVMLVSGSPALKSQGTVVVQGSAVLANPPLPPTTFLGFAGVTGYYVLATILAVVGVTVGTLLVIVRARRRGRKQARAQPPCTQ